MSGPASNTGWRSPVGTFLPLEEGENPCEVCDWDFSTEDTREAHITTRIMQEDDEHIAHYLNARSL